MANIETADLFAGKALRTIRELNNETQERLAPILGVTFQQIQKYEKGTNRISPAKIKKACVYFGCSPLMFFEGYDSIFTQYEKTKNAQDKLTAIKSIIEKE